VARSNQRNRNAPSGKGARPQQQRNAPGKSRKGGARATPPPRQAPRAWNFPVLPRVPLEARDSLYALATGIGCVCLFLTTFSGHASLGDSPESIAGVRTLGILHAPGYPSYVLAGHLFGTVLPFGSWAFRVNLFSLVCAALTCGVLFLVARLFGASRAGAAIGAIGFATTASFWLNADFAKHYPWTALTLIATVLFVLLARTYDSTKWLVAGAVSLAAAFASGWQLALIVGVGLVAMLWLDGYRPGRRALWLTGGVLVGTTVAFWLFVIVRAGQDPRLDWGSADSIGNLIHLILRKDFEDVQSGSGQAAGPGFFTVFGGLFGGLVRDFGLGVIALAIVGAAIPTSLRRGERSFLVGLVVVNVLAVVIGSGVDGVEGFRTVLAYDGYLLGAMLAIAVLAAVGTTFVVAIVRERIGNPAALAVVAVVAVLAIVPSIVVHRSHADLRTPAFADSYARQMFAELPPHAVLMTWSEESEMPMWYRQITSHARPDVTVVAVNGLQIPWERAQIAKRLGLGDALNRTDGSGPALLHALVTGVGSRPVYLDALAPLFLNQVVGYSDDGLVAHVVGSADGPQANANAARDGNALTAEERSDGLISGPANGSLHPTQLREPFFPLYLDHYRAHIELAKALAIAGDRAGTLRELHRAATLFPAIGTAQQAIQIVDQTPTKDLAQALRTV
jgi:4-amino-4-deoxy-L-arabinose transferase-like glycosyltransferase